MTEQLIEGQETNIQTLAKELRDMADRLEANGIAYFGGCFVVLPPMGFDPLSALILDNKQDAAQFFALLKTKCDMQLMGIEEQQRGSRGFGR